MAAVTICSNFGAPQNKVWHCFHCFPIYFPWSDGPDAMILVFWMLSFKPTFSRSTFTFIRIFSNESALCIQWPKIWSFSFHLSPSKEHPGLISFRMDWLDLLAVQGTLKSLLQHHSSKASILWCSAFFIVQLSHPYMTAGKTIALTRWTFVGKVCLCFWICYLG